MTNRQAGRPFSPEITEGILEEAERVMTSDGFSSMKVDRIVHKVGTTRAAFYRRFPNAAHLAFEVIVNKFGSTGLVVDVGSLRGDLLATQSDTIDMFSAPLMRNSLLGLLESIRTDEVIGERYREHFVGPRRDMVGIAIERAVARGELNDGVDYALDVVCDLLLGPILARLMLPIDLPLNEGLAEWTTDAACRYLEEQSGQAV